ncbi:MAG: hypothetical protein IMW91_04120 [Firmicutes bacterium]|nr:hypothetical protein [Bacillota bacterium]
MAKLAQQEQQEVVAQRLRRAIVRDHLPPLLCFVSAPQASSRALVEALAQAWLCDAPLEGDACQSCDGCRMVLHGVHPDMFVVVAQGASIGIDSVRQLLERMGRRPRAAHRFFAIEQAERLTVEAQNALLRFLEELPVGTVGVLLTSQSERLLPTVRSRMVQVRLARESRAQREAALRADGWGESAHTAAFAPSEEEGNLLADPAAFAAADELAAEVLHALGQAEIADAFFGLERALRHHADRLFVTTLLVLMAAWLRDLFAEQAGQAPQQRMHGERSLSWGKETFAASLSQRADDWARLLDWAAVVEENGNPHLAATAALLEAASS